MLDHQPATGLETNQHEPARSLDPRTGLAAGVRWHCAWTAQQRETIAARAIKAAGFKSYLPLHLERYANRTSAIIPLFPRYCFVAFDADADAWGVIPNLRGVCGLIRHGYDKPTSLPAYAITELLARTSTRGVVDDPGETAWKPPGAGYSPVWQSMASLDAGSRCRLLYRLFGASVTKLALEDAA